LWRTIGLTLRTFSGTVSALRTICALRALAAVLPVPAFGAARAVLFRTVRALLAFRSIGSLLTALSLLGLTFLASCTLLIATLALTLTATRTLFFGCRGRTNRRRVADLHLLGQQFDLGLQFFVWRFEAGRSRQFSYRGMGLHGLRLLGRFGGLIARFLGLGSAAGRETFGNNVAILTLLRSRIGRWAAIICLAGLLLESFVCHPYTC
jgi:hypothetical protein